MKDIYGFFKDEETENNNRDESDLCSFSQCPNIHFVLCHPRFTQLLTISICHLKSYQHNTYYHYLIKILSQIPLLAKITPFRF